MATLLHRLGTTAFRHWPRFLAGWLVVLLALGAFSAAFAKPLSENFTIPGIPSEEAADLQAELFPGSESAFDAANVNVVVQALWHVSAFREAVLACRGDDTLLAALQSIFSDRSQRSEWACLDRLDNHLDSQRPRR